MSGDRTARRTVLATVVAGLSGLAGCGGGTGGSTVTPGAPDTPGTTSESPTTTELPSLTSSVSESSLVGHDLGFSLSGVGGRSVTIELSASDSGNESFAREIEATGGDGGPLGSLSNSRGPQLARHNGDSLQRDTGGVEMPLARLEPSEDASP